MRYFLIAIFCFLNCINAHANWVEARSDNFVLIADTSEKKARLIVNELEEYRSVILKLLRVDSSTEMVPIRIYGVKSVKTVETLTGRTNVAGLYKTVREGPVFILDISGSFDRNYGARAIAYHEFTHHLIATYTNTVYPRWYNEGLAEYLSTFRINDNGDVRIGMPSEQNARVLASHGWMDMNILVNSVRNYPVSSGPSRQRFSQSQFYAQSWIATHYIQSHNEYAKKFKTYLTRLNQDDVPEDVFEKAFGLSPEAFGDILKRYFKQNKFNSASLTLLKHERNFQIDMRHLSKGEAEFHKGEAIRRFNYSPKRDKLLEKYYSRSMEFQGPKAEIYASRALVDIRNSNEKQALEAISAALALEPENSRVLQISGHVSLKAYENKDTPSDREQLLTARRYLKKSMRANPRNMRAHFDYVTSYSMTGDTASNQAVYSAQECANYYKSRNFVDTNMSLVSILAKNDKWDFAKNLLEKSKVWSRVPQIRMTSRRMLKALSNEKMAFK